MFIGTVTSIETYDDQDDEFWVSWDEGGQSQCDYRTLTLYVQPETTCGCPGGYVKEATAPEAKFKVGDVVVNTQGNRWTVTEVEFVDGTGWCYYSDEPGYDLECYVTLYVPPTPAELIPTLVEHEWVRGEWDNGKTFIGTTHFHSGDLMVGVSVLSDSTWGVPKWVKIIERCNAPEVK